MRKPLPYEEMDADRAYRFSAKLDVLLQLVLVPVTIFVFVAITAVLFFITEF